MSAIPTVQLAFDLKRMSRMTCYGPRARVVETLCAAIEIELQRRAEAAMRSLE